jgi:transposase
VLDYVPGRFRVIRHVRPKYTCKACDAIAQAPALAMPTPRGRATPAMLAHLLVSKYCDHLQLYRQSEIYARDGLELDRSTLCDWVGQAVWLLQPSTPGRRRCWKGRRRCSRGATPRRTAVRRRMRRNWLRCMRRSAN